MQIIPAAVQTLLKSRKQVGADRPAYEVTIGGQPAGDYDWASVTAWTTPDTTELEYELSVIKKTDGKIMVARVIDGAVYVGECDSVEDLTTGNDTVTTWAATGISGAGDAVEARAFRLEDGYDTDGVYLIISDSGVSGTVNTTVKIYKSASGNGGDWALYSTVYSAARAGTTPFTLGEYGLGIPKVLPSGRWVLIAPHFFIDGSYFVGVYGIYTSDDDGVTWTYRYSFGLGPWHGAYYMSSSKQIYLSDTGNLFCFFVDDYGTAELNIVKSTDNGVTWDIAAAPGIVGFGPVESGQISLIEFNGRLLLFVASKNNGISSAWEFTDPDTDLAAYTKITDLPTMLPSSYCWYLLAQKVGDDLVICGNNRVLGVMPAGGDRLVVKSITIDRSRGASAAQATIVLDNTGGVYSPDGTGAWAGVLMPNALITVKQGYGADLAQTFVGYIDSVEMTSFPAELRISCRDKGKLALDRIVTNAVDGGHYVKFTSTTVEDAVTALAGLCGLTVGTVEATGMTLTSKLFSWESYADAIDWLADISSSSWRVDELGVLHFTRDVMPTSPVTAYAFSEGEDIISLGYLISDEQLYYTATVYGTKDYAGTVNTSGVTVTWVSGDKFETAWAEDKIITIDGSTYRIDAVASDTSLTVKATIGTKTGVNYQLADVIKASANFGAPLTYGLFSQKVLKIDASDADTLAKCQEIADRAVALMLCRCRVVDFAAIAVPWLQVGDFIQVVETTSTISELYRVTDISLNQDPSGFTMGVTCYWYGEVPS